MAAMGWHQDWVSGRDDEPTGVAPPGGADGDPPGGANVAAPTTPLATSDPDAWISEPPRTRWALSHTQVAVLGVVGMIAALALGLSTCRGSQPGSGYTGIVSPVAVPIPGASEVPASDPPLTAAESTAPAGTAPAGTPLGGAAASQPPEPAMLTVAVAGLVARPGVVHLGSGSRVEDAINSAGGALAGADLVTINLARRLNDGDQIIIGTAEALAGDSPPTRSAVVGELAAAAAGPPGRGAGGVSSGGVAGAEGAPPAAAAPINLNTADVTELDQLPGIGPVLAAEIVAYRDGNGPFASVDDLRNVSGIGESRMARIRDLVSV